MRFSSCIQEYGTYMVDKRSRLVPEYGTEDIRTCPSYRHYLSPSSLGPNHKLHQLPRLTHLTPVTFTRVMYHWGPEVTTACRWPITGFKDDRHLQMSVDRSTLWDDSPLWIEGLRSKASRRPFSFFVVFSLQVAAGHATIRSSLYNGTRCTGTRTRRASLFVPRWRSHKKRNYS